MYITLSEGIWLCTDALNKIDYIWAYCLLNNCWYKVASSFPISVEVGSSSCVHLNRRSYGVFNYISLHLSTKDTSPLEKKVLRKQSSEGWGECLDVSHVVQMNSSYCKCLHLNNLPGCYRQVVLRPGVCCKRSNRFTIKCHGFIIHGSGCIELCGDCSHLVVVISPLCSFWGKLYELCLIHPCTLISLPMNVNHQ